MFFRKLSELMWSRRQLAADWSHRNRDVALIPTLSRRLDEHTQASAACTCTPCMDGSYNIRHLGETGPGGLTHPWRLVSLPEKECICRCWQDELFSCVHAVCAAVADGVAIDTLYDKQWASIAHFQETYSVHFVPYSADSDLVRDSTLLLPAVDVVREGKGKRGLKPDLKPKHKRKKAVGGH